MTPSPTAALALAVATALGVASIAACQPTRYVGFRPLAAESPQLRQPVGGTDPGLRSFYLWGLLPRREVVEARAICGAAGIAELETVRSAGEIFLYSLSAGLFAPYTARVTCGPAASPSPPAPSG